MLDLQFAETDAPQEVEVTAADLRALRRAQGGLTVQQTSEKTARVGPRTGYVGSLLLPSGTRIIVRPKAPIANFTDLLVLAYRTLALPSSRGSASVAETNPSDWLLLQLADEVSELTSRGLGRGYVEQRELLPVLRGRMRPPTNPARLPLQDCEYVEFTADTLENRLLRSTLELLAPSVQSREIRKRVYAALAGFGEVSPMHPSVSHFDRVTITRLNHHYEPALRLARLALEGTGVTDELGSEKAPSYFLPLWRVWEAAIANALRDASISHVKEQPEYTDRIVQEGGVPTLTATLKPDLILGPRHRPRLVIDTKWAAPLLLHRGARRLRNDHIYQLATYCTALNCDGILVYPLIEDQVRSEYLFNGRRLRLRTIDLAEPGLRSLYEFAAEVADEVRC